MDEDVVHIYNGILLRHKKECIWVSSNEVNEPRAYYTEWSKSEREKQILCINVGQLGGEAHFRVDHSPVAHPVGRRYSRTQVPLQGAKEEGAP